jgi:hypothetical protein
MLLGLASKTVDYCSAAKQIAVNFESLCKFYFAEVAEEQCLLSPNHTIVGEDETNQDFFQTDFIEHSFLKR